MPLGGSGDDCECFACSGGGGGGGGVGGGGGGVSGGSCPGDFSPQANVCYSSSGTLSYIYNSAGDQIGYCSGSSPEYCYYDASGNSVFVCTVYCGGCEYTNGTSTFSCGSVYVP